jgi:negative regulator of flagellin synthesis FlgM
MTIGRVAPTEPIQNSKEIGRAKQTVRAGDGDSVSISTEAKEKAERLRTLEIVVSSPDVRADRVAELKAKINDPSYINDTLIAGAADKIVDMLLPPS